MAAVCVLPAPSWRKTSPKLPSSVAGILTTGWASLTNSSHPISRGTSGRKTVGMEYCLYGES